MAAVSEEPTDCPSGEFPTSRKLLIYAGNPTQYHAPLFRTIAECPELDAEVLYADDIGAKPFYNPELRAVIDWDLQLLDGYPYRFFRNRSRHDRKGFWSRNNPDMFGYVFSSDATHVLIHGYDTLSSWYVFAASVLSGKKIIWRGETIERRTNKRPLVSVVKRVILPVYFFFCQTVLFSCKANRACLAKYLSGQRGKLVPFPCSVDNDFFVSRRVETPSAIRAIRSDHGISHDTLLIASCCRLTKRKRVHLIINAIAEMRSADVTLLLIGSGPERETLLQLARTLGVRVVVTGFVGQKVVAQLLSASDVFVLLSSYDASPKALNEAMNFSLPLVVSDGIGTAADLVRDGVNGYVLHGEDRATLVTYFNVLAEDPHERSRMGRNNREILKSYSFDADVQGLRTAMLSDA